LNWHSTASLAVKSRLFIHPFHKQFWLFAAPVDGADANLVQVRAGLAWFFRRYAKEPPPDRRQQHAEAEVQAQAERRGLWADAEPVAPWDWRAAKGASQRQ